MTPPPTKHKRFILVSGNRIYAPNGLPHFPTREEAERVRQTLTGEWKVEESSYWK